MKHTSFDVIFTAVYFMLGVYLGYALFSSGYMYGFNNGYYGISNSYVKKRIVKEGNILKYPFGKTSGEAEKKSGSDIVDESGIVKETVEENEGA